MHTVNGLKLLENDDILRLLFAFYACIGRESNWKVEGQYARKNRKIAKRLLPQEDYADYYYFIGHHFYALNLERQQDNAFCHLREYETFFNLTNQYKELRFTYNIPKKEIVQLGELVEISIPTYKKRIK